MNMTKDRLHGRKTLKVTEFLDEFEKDDVKKTVDIVQLFSSFGVTLSKKGKSFVGRCPWHEDPTPSLSVDREKGLYNCFGCGEAGDVFTLVEKMKGCGFKEALEYLRKVESRTSKVESDDAATPKPPASRAAHQGDDARGTDAVRDAAPMSPETGGMTLTAVAEYYHKQLFQHEEALAYLKGRGLAKAELYMRYQIGYADGSLLAKIGESQRRELQRIGVLTEKGREHFRRCVVFPILDELGQVVSLYGRAIDDAAGTKHLYLKGKHRGVFNRKASKVYDEIILTESVIDALSLMELGIENVQSIYGTGGFTEEHLQLLKDDRVKTVVLALDNDEPGRIASEKLKEKLLGEGFAVKVVCPADLIPPAPFSHGEKGEIPAEDFSPGKPSPVGEGAQRAGEVKDWNEYLLAGGSREAVKEAFEKAEVYRPTGEAVAVTVSEEEGGYSFTLGEMSYRVTGVKELFIGSLRVSIRAARGGERYYDTVELYSARSRASFAANLSKSFSLEPRRIEKDLIAILEHLEARRDRALRGEAAKEQEMTADERARGVELLTDPRFFERIVEDMTSLGYVGEELNKQLIYLAASSRKLDDPLSVIIVSQSASGKSMLVDTVKKLMPPEEVIAVTSLSEQALNYVGDLSHKFLVLGEAVHGETVEHQLREMLSAKELSRLVTVKDPKTGEMKTRMVKTEAVVASVMTTTEYAVNPENASRSFLINADESKEQTERIHEAQRLEHTIARHREKRRRAGVIAAAHVAAQRLLRKIAVDNPLAAHVRFPSGVMRTRRDHARFLELISAVAYLRQYQKEAHKDDDGVEYIVCDLDDYRIAYRIIRGVLDSTFLELPRGAIQMYEEFRDLAREEAVKRSVEVHEVSLTQRELREHTGLNNTFIKRALRTLADYEYLLIERGGKSRSKGYYRLRADQPMESFNFSMIPSPEEIERVLCT